VNILHNKQLRYTAIAILFGKLGTQSFGGWSTTALLMEKELVVKRQVLTAAQMHHAIAYAQTLPGATQVALTANAGYQMRGWRGAVVATGSYVFPAVTLVVLFAALYFRYANGAAVAHYTGGLTAALSGIILANAVRLGRRHVTRPLLWLACAGAAAAVLWLEVRSIVLIAVFGSAGLLAAVVLHRKKARRG